MVVLADHLHFCWLLVTPGLVLPSRGTDGCARQFIDKNSAKWFKQEVLRRSIMVEFIKKKYLTTAKV